VAWKLRSRVGRIELSPPALCSLGPHVGAATRTGGKAEVVDGIIVFEQSDVMARRRRGTRRRVGKYLGDLGAATRCRAHPWLYDGRVGEGVSNARAASAPVPPRGSSGGRGGCVDPAPSTTSSHRRLRTHEREVLGADHTGAVDLHGWTARNTTVSPFWFADCTFSAMHAHERFGSVHGSVSLRGGRNRLAAPDGLKFNMVLNGFPPRYRLM